MALIDGKALAERIRSEIAEEVRELGEIGLATVLVGDDPASDIYIRLKHKAAAEVGINAKDFKKNARLLEQPKGSMCNYIVNVTDAKEVDNELIAWIKSAYEGAD